MANMEDPNTVARQTAEELMKQGSDLKVDTMSSGPSVVPMPLKTLNEVAGTTSKAVSIISTKRTLETMMDVPVTLTFEVGRTDISIKQLMALAQGAFIGLRKSSLDSISVLLNDTKISTAEAISSDKRYGIRFGEIEKLSNVKEALKDE